MRLAPEIEAAHRGYEEKQAEVNQSALNHRWHDVSVMCQKQWPSKKRLIMARPSKINSVKAESENGYNNYGMAISNGGGLNQRGASINEIMLGVFGV